MTLKIMLIYSLSPYKASISSNQGQFHLFEPGTLEASERQLDFVAIRKNKRSPFVLRI